MGGKGRWLGLLAAVCLGALALGGWTLAEKTALTGRYLQSKNGAHLIISEEGSPVVLGDPSGAGELFRGLSDGDRVLVLCGGMAESYPGHADALWLLRLEEGEYADLPAQPLEQLTQLGWI